MDSDSHNWPKYGLKEPKHYGWAGEWHSSENLGIAEQYELYKEIYEWLLVNIQNPYINSQIYYNSDRIYVQMRKNNDYTLFMLRWA